MILYYKTAEKRLVNVLQNGICILEGVRKV